VIDLKNLNVAISDEDDARLDKVIRVKGFKNRADAASWLINLGFKEIKGGT
jgi:hypothetical protein